MSLVGSSQLFVNIIIHSTYLTLDLGCPQLILKTIKIYCPNLRDLPSRIDSLQLTQESGEEETKGLIISLYNTNKNCQKELYKKCLKRTLSKINLKSSLFETFNRNVDYLLQIEYLN